MEEPSIQTSRSLGNLQVSEETLTLRNVETLLLTAQQQHLRHLRRLKQMRRQVEITEATQQAWAKKQAADDRRIKAREAELKERQKGRIEQSKEVEQRIAGAQQAARSTQELWRRELAGKLEAARQRTDLMLRQRSLLSEFSRVQSVRIEARRQRTYAKHERALEERRAALLQKEEMEARHLKQQQELRLIQEEIRREEKALAAVRREQIRRRAETDAAEKSTYWGLRAAQRDRQLAERKQDLDFQRTARSEEARARAAYNAQRLDHAAVAEQVKRDRLAVRLQNKMSKVDAIMAQRAALVREVKLVQGAMEAQEKRMREALDGMQRTGKWQLPKELLESAAALESAMSAFGALSQEASCVTYRPPSPGQRSTTSALGGGSLAETMPCLQKAFRVGARPGAAPAAAPRTAAEEAELQRVLEEEIVREMQREAALAQETDHEERKRMLRQFAAEREAAKVRILAVGYTAN